MPRPAVVDASDVTEIFIYLTLCELFFQSHANAIQGLSNGRVSVCLSRRYIPVSAAGARAQQQLCRSLLPAPELRLRVASCREPRYEAQQRLVKG